LGHRTWVGCEGWVAFKSLINLSKSVVPTCGRGPVVGASIGGKS
jgi:hypothetical protein